MEAEVQTEAPQEIPFVLLEKINTQAATSSDVFIENVKINVKRKLPWLHNLPEFQKVKGNSKKIALVGGGPSLDKYVDDIKQFKTIIICGSSNDWAMKNGIIPTYAVICDPDPISVNYYTSLDTEVKYLLAASCDPKIYEHLKEKQVVMWHCHSDEAIEKLKGHLEGEYHAIGGGCTVGLRALSIAVMLGYSNIHLFGFDSSLGDNDKHHAYDFSDASEELGQIYNIKVGKDTLVGNEKTFHCAGYQLAQADHFKDFYTRYNQYFNPTFYGDGLLPTLMAQIFEEKQRLESSGVVST